MILAAFLFCPAPAWAQSEESAARAALDAASGVGEVERFEDLLAREDGTEFEYNGRTYVWQDGTPFEKNPDGSLVAIEAPDRLFEVGADGQQWLSREADGTIYISVAPKIWASINFEHNSDVIKDESKPVLDVFGESLKMPALLRHRLIIAGHTNSRGMPDYNLDLSRRRAQSVSRYLAERHAIDPARLILHGYGAARPIADNATEEGLAKNRRVEFILISPPAGQSPSPPAGQSPAPPAGQSPAPSDAAHPIRGEGLGSSQAQPGQEAVE